MCKLIAFNKKQETAVLPNVHVSAIISSIYNGEVSQVQFCRNNQVVVDIFDQQSALMFARRMGEHHTYTSVIVYRQS